MKVKLIFVLIASFLLLIPAVPVFSQSELTDYEETYSAYRLSIEDYQNAHNTYILARAQYLRFQTQQSRDEAHSATLAMLTARDEVVILYLESLKAKLAASQGVVDTNKNDLVVELDSEIAWFSDHKLELESAISLDDLVGDSKQAENRFKRVEALAYRELSNLSFGNLFVLKERLTDFYTDLENKVELIATDEIDENNFSQDKLQVIDRWMVDSRLHIQRAEEKEAEALTNIGKTPQFNLVGYNNILKTLEEERLLMGETASFLGEVMRQIKTAN